MALRAKVVGITLITSTNMPVLCGNYPEVRTDTTALQRCHFNKGSMHTEEMT